MVTQVLILVVVDNGLVLVLVKLQKAIDLIVLILVVVDNGLVHIEIKVLDKSKTSLNPCCSGQWSRTRRHHSERLDGRNVLILVVVDNGLVHYYVHNFS